MILALDLEQVETDRDSWVSLASLAQLVSCRPMRDLSSKEVDSILRMTSGVLWSMSTHMCTHRHTHVHRHVHTHVHAHVHTNVCTHVHKPRHTHRHTFIIKKSI